MKPRRIIARCLLLSTLLTALLALSACKPRVVEITRYETDMGRVPEPIVSADFASYERFLEAYSYYYYKFPSFGRLLLPREGEFVTADGERFVATVSQPYIAHFKDNLVHCETTVRFVLEIRSPSGEPIMEQKLELHLRRKPTSSEFTQSDKIPEEIVRYWDAVKITPEELFGREREEG